jgi:2-polyprenyl-3-methyl-5-hydroxy-6-metoxy-1,4-benzoquinol methylase
MMETKVQTAQSFRDKWHNNRQLAFDETLREGSDILNWILSRNGLGSVPKFEEWPAGRKRILDAGCGNGRVTALLRRYAHDDAQVIGIDLTAAHIAAHNLGDAKNVDFQQRDLLRDLSGLGKFDLIYCQEVLHHTANPSRAFQNLAKSLFRQEAKLLFMCTK